jgi:hypothetical protein
MSNEMILYQIAGGLSDGDGKYPINGYYRKQGMLWQTNRSSYVNTKSYDLCARQVNLYHFYNQYATKTLNVRREIEVLI